MLKYVLPKIPKGDVPAMLGVSAVGAFIAGGYGVLHDQVTYSISAEYFTKLKFHQFSYADFGLGQRIFPGTVGFLATWWVGFFAGWFLARRLIPNQPRRLAYRQIRNGIACIFSTALASGALGYFYGLWRGSTGDLSSWQSLLRQLHIDDSWAFVRVAYIHNFSYVGALVGLIIAFVAIRPGKLKVESQ